MALAGFLGLAMMTSCGGGKTGSESSAGAASDEATVETAAPDAEQMARGEKIFNEKCFACHQANGQGIPNVFPSLVGSDFLLNQKVLAVSQVLNGSEKVSASKTVKYPAPMPPQLDNKEDAVAVINYVLNNFGNKGGYVTLEQVKDVVIEPR